jgi:hypothetical protein
MRARRTRVASGLADNLELEAWGPPCNDDAWPECPAFFDFTRRLSARLDSFCSLRGHGDLEISQIIPAGAW